MPRRTAIAALVFNALVWGVSWWPFRMVDAAGLHSLWATALVYAFCFGLTVVWQPSAGVVAARVPAMWLLGLAAGATNACFNWAVTTGDVVRVVLLFYLMPLWAMLLARVALGEALRVAAGLRAALAIAGAVLVLAPGAAAWPVPQGSADWLALIGGFCFAATNVLLRREGGRAPAERALAMFAGGMLVPGALATTLALGGSSTWLPPLSWDWLGGTAGLAVAFLAGNLALQYGAARLPSSLTSVVMLSEVLFAAGSAIALGAAVLTWPTVAGGGLIVAACLLAALDRNVNEPASK